MTSLLKASLPYRCVIQEVSDARRIRLQLLTNIERSLDPGLSDAERRRLTHIVIVGGGPTGIEFGAELYDFCKTVARIMSCVIL
jgi:NADH:ubiquinone reductase (non-electrogenic)